MLCSHLLLLLCKHHVPLRLLRFQACSAGHVRWPMPQLCNLFGRGSCHCTAGCPRWPGRILNLTSGRRKKLTIDFETSCFDCLYRSLNDPQCFKGDNSFYVNCQQLTSDTVTFVYIGWLTGAAVFFRVGKSEPVANFELVESFSEMGDGLIDIFCRLLCICHRIHVKFCAQESLLKMKKWKCFPQTKAAPEI